MKLIIVGIKQDDGSIKHLKVFTSETWANKYAQSAGEFAVFAYVDTEFGKNNDSIID